MRARLNLASRPFRNEALPNLGFVAGALLLLLASGQHALHLRRLTGEGSGALHQQVAGLEQELAALRREAQAARFEAPAPATLAEWRAVAALVDRRSFSWSLLLSRLESVVPPGVRLLSIAPNNSSGRMGLEVSALAKTRAEGFEFARALEAQGSFKNVYPQSVASSARGEEFSLVMLYDPPEEPR